MNARQIIDEAVDPKRTMRLMQQFRRDGFKVGEEILPATSDTGQIMQATLDKLKELNPSDYAEEMTDEVQEYLNGNLPPDFDPEYYLYERLFPHMGLYCPPFSYFGSFEADGSIGCWPYSEEALQEFVDKGVLVIQEGDEPDWSDRGIIGYHQYLILMKTRGGQQCWDIRGTPFMVWDW